MCKKLLTLAVSLAVLCGCLCVPFPAKAATAASPGSLSSLSAILMEPQTGRVLYEKDAHRPRAMASTTKLMTALLAWESGLWEQDVTATAEAVRVEGSALGLRAGDRISMRDLVTGLLLASGNDAANVVAYAVAGDLPRFAERMNAKAAALGMQDSLFVTPSGLDEGDHHSTAYDMALLARAVLDVPELAAICAMKSATVEMGAPKRRVTVTNHNKLLNLYPYAVGMKTGFTKKSGRCLVSAAQKDGVTLIAVTLNGGDDWNDHMALYDYGFAQMQAVTPAVPELPRVPVAGGVTGWVTAETTPPSTFPLQKDEAAQLHAVVELEPFLWAPVVKGQRIGSVCYQVGDRVLEIQPIRAAYGVEARPRLSYAQKWRRYWQKMLRVLLG